MELRKLGLIITGILFLYNSYLHLNLSYFQIFFPLLIAIGFDILYILFLHYFYGMSYKNIDKYMDDDHEN